MNSRERVITALSHKEPDRIPLDFGSTMVTSIMGIAYSRLKTYLGLRDGSTKLCDPVQQLAQPEIEILERIGADVLPVWVSEHKKWKTCRLPDGSFCEVPESFSPELSSDGSQVLRDATGQVTLKMPEGGYYFDQMYYPLRNISSQEELKKHDFYTPIRKEVLDDLHERVQNLYETTDYALILHRAGGIFEPAVHLRGWDTFMMDLAAAPRFAEYLMDKILEANIRRMEQILPVVGDYIQVIKVADDLGAENGLLLSPELYRKTVKPRQKKLYRYIKENTDAYLFLHTCGSVYEIIPDFIEMGVDVLNPIQVSAKNMGTGRLKKEFGEDIAFWGGGCDTQQVLPFGTTDQVKQEVKRRIEDLAPGGGFVFAQVHNIQADVPPENLMAMWETVREHWTY